MKNGKDETIENEVFELCEKALNDELSAENLERLESLVVEHVRARKIYVEYMHQHAGLYWQHAGDSESFSVTSLVTGSSDEGSTEESGLPAENHRNVDNKVLQGPWAWRKIAAVAAVLVGGVVLGWGVSGRVSSETSVATLIKATNCSWRSGALPTDEGAKLGAGRLRLKEGLARLRFSSGAEIILEAPVDIELITPMLCRLHMGTVVAKVPEQAIGFVIETESAKLVDFGTEFGVHVGESGEGTNVLVFDGIVDVEQKKSGKVQRLTTGNGSKVSSEVFETTELAPLELVAGGARAVFREGFSAKKTIVITTAYGRGEDAYVQATDSDTHLSDVLLLTKNSEVFDVGLGYSRKVYLRFDLDDLPTGNEVTEAELVLTVKRSDFGYASFVPDAEFVVYGVSNDSWERSSINWENAPANNHSGGAADTSIAVELGSFKIPQGIYSGEVGVEGGELVKFLQQEKKADGLATILVVRKTGEIRRGGGLVHAFASKRHPRALPPTLRVAVKD